MTYYSLKDPMEAFEVADVIARRYGDSQQIRVGLSEIILNAIEHGNLEIGFEKKSKLLSSGSYLDVVSQRLQDGKYADRIVHIYAVELRDRVSITVIDEGRGFDPAPFLRFDEARKNLPHGRGIAIARLNCFDELSYSEKGNAVTCISCAH